VKAKVSFCTTCSNRSHQLKQVFDDNARKVAESPGTEWVIVNYNSSDDLDNYLLSRLPHVSERILYFRETSRRPWHVSVAKNIAHRVASGEVLMNLDCDNTISNAADVIRVYAMSGCKVLHMWSGKLGDGTYGRIAIAKDVFHALGGYDESFYPMGYQDYDLVRRATAAGVLGRRLQCPPGMALPNTKEESIRHCGIKGMTWDDFNRANRARSLSNVAAGRLVANSPHGWAPMKIERVDVPRISTG
jgi:hypothetical protein